MNIAYYMLLSAVAAVVPVTITFVVTLKEIRRAHEKEMKYTEKQCKLEIEWANRAMKHQEHEISILINFNDRYTEGEIKSISERWRIILEETENIRNSSGLLAKVNQQHQQHPRM